VNVRSSMTAIVFGVSALLLAACGGGSVNSTPLATNTAPAVQSLAAFTSTASVASVPAGAAVTLPALTPPTGVATGTSASIGLAAQSTGGSIGSASATMSSTLPSGAPVLANIARVAEGSRSPETESSPINGILYFLFSISATPPPSSFTFPAPPTFTITLPTAYFSLSGASFYLGLFDPTKPSLDWQSRVESCVPNANTSTIVCSGSQSFTIVNGVSYLFALYVVSAGAVAPTPVPSVQPTSVATIAPPSASGNVTLSTGATVTLPTIAGAGGTITLGTVSQSTTVAVTTYLQVPPGIANPGNSYPVPFYVTLTPATTVTISGSSSAVFTPPTTWVGPTSNNACPYIEMYDTSRFNGWYLKALAGNCAGNGGANNSASFSTTQSMTLTGGVEYVFAPYPSN
jgi:hypothetical protein